jgi:hypothetical protein
VGVAAFIVVTSVAGNRRAQPSEYPISVIKRMAGTQRPDRPIAAIPGTLLLRKIQAGTLRLDIWIFILCLIEDAREKSGNQSCASRLLCFVGSSRTRFLSSSSKASRSRSSERSRRKIRSFAERSAGGRRIVQSERSDTSSEKNARNSTAYRSGLGCRNNTRKRT